MNKQKIADTLNKAAEIHTEIAVVARNLSKAITSDIKEDYCDSAYNDERTSCSMSGVRVLPTGSSSNALLCKNHFDHEIEWRKRENKRLADFAKFDLPEWDDLKVYTHA